MGIFTTLIQAAATKAPSNLLPVGPRTGVVSMLGGGVNAASQIAQMTSYGNVAWLFATVSRIAQATSTVPWRLFRTMPNGDDQEIFTSPLLDLWRNVNPFETGQSYRESGQQHLDLTGEWWTVFVDNIFGRPAEMQLLRPDRMTVIPDKDDYIKGYIYTFGQERIPLLPEQVMFIKMPSPLDPFRGMGPIQSLMSDIESERESALWARNFFRNSAMPGGIIEMEDTVDDPAFERFVERWQQQHQGTNNAHRVAVLERAHWVDRKITQRDMQFVDFRKFNRDIILGGFGMPKALIGATDDVNRANAEAAEVMFTRWLIRPRLTRIQGTVNQRLTPRYGENLELRADNPVPSDRTVDIEEGQKGYDSGILSLNESRARFGEGEVEGGDEFKQPIAPSDPAMLRALKGLEPRVWALKAPDKLLPDNVEEAEAEVMEAWLRRLEAEAAAIAAHLGQFMVRSTSGLRLKLEPSDINTYNWDWWEKYSDEVIAELENLFVLQIAAEFPEMAAGEVQRLAAIYARTRGALLLQLDGGVNLVQFTRRRVNELVARTIEDGLGLGQLQTALREDVAFSRSRARMVARTETASALGEGGKQAAVSQGRDEKRWITQGPFPPDEVCRLNEDQGWIKFFELFQSGHDTIPAHPSCECVVRYRTSEVAISDTDPAEGLENDVGSAIAESRSIIREVRCPDGHIFPMRNFSGSTDAFCRTCKKQFTVITDMVRKEHKIVTRDSDGAISEIIVMGKE